MTTQNSIIPAEESTQYDSWQMPEVKDGQVTQTEKLKNRDSKGQLVDVEKDEIIYNAITAGQLEEISNQIYEDVREQAYQDGYKQGHEQGTNAGLEEGRDTITEQSVALNTTLQHLNGYLDGQDDEIEKALVNIAVCVSRSILQRELTIESSQIRHIVAHAISTLPMNSGNIQVYLSKQDQQLLNSYTDIPEGWSLRVDSGLTPGGCYVKTDHSVVEYTLEEQFQQVVNELVEERFSKLILQEKIHSESKINELQEDCSEVGNTEFNTTHTLFKP